MSDDVTLVEAQVPGAILQHGLRIALHVKHENTQQLAGGTFGIEAKRHAKIQHAARVATVIAGVGTGNVQVESFRFQAEGPIVVGHSASEVVEKDTDAAAPMVDGG